MKTALITQTKSKKDVLGILDLADRMEVLIDSAIRLKKKLGKNGTIEVAKGHVLGLLFEKPSTRTRLSFDIGFRKLGGEVVVLNKSDLQLSRGETLKDTAKVFDRMLDAVAFRAYKSTDIADLAHHAAIPVINALDNREHPCQILADFMTLKERFGKLSGLEVAYVGDAANNVARSLLLAAPVVGINLRLLSPEGYRPDAESLALAQRLAKERGTTIALADFSPERLKGVHAVVTDTWVSMGDEAEATARLQAFEGYTIKPAHVKVARKDAVFLHCLPAHYGHEVDESVAHGAQSVVFDEAENRMWAQMALLMDLLDLAPPS